MAAYCERSNSCALADHGMSSQSRHTHDVWNSSQKPTAVSAACNAGQKPPLEIRVVEESPPGARVDDADFVLDDAKPLPRRQLVATDDRDGARSHVLLLADDSRATLIAEIRERFGRMFEQPRLGRLSPTATSSAANRSATSGWPRIGS